jgi:hypothetical protein
LKFRGCDGVREHESKNRTALSKSRGVFQGGLEGVQNLIITFETVGGQTPGGC